MIKYVLAAILLGGIAWLGAGIARYMEVKEELGQLRYIDTLQKESLDMLLRQTEENDVILQLSAAQRRTRDEAGRVAAKSLYEAKDLETDLDRPLPGSLVQPLRLQYQTISASDAGDQK